MRFVFFLALLAVSVGARAQHILQWERFNIYVDLDNDGRVRVKETLEVFLNGKIASLDRKFAASSALQVIEPRISALGSDDTFHPIAEAEYRETERTLYWPIAASDAPEWADARKTFRLEYELRGVLAPAWDIPIGPGSFLDRGNFPHLRDRLRETLQAWREPPRRYRFDHDVLFARFSNEGPRELNYTFHYDTAWRHPQPDAPLRSRVTPDENYRVTELRDYLRPGRPPAVEHWPAVVRLSSIAASIVLPLLLWLAFAANRIRVHGLHGPRLDREWFRTHILPLTPEDISPPASVTLPPRFARFLARMRRRGVIEIQQVSEGDETRDPVLRLQLLANPSSLPRFERALLGRLFADRRQVTTTELGEIYAKTGFVPAEALGDALEEAAEADEDREPARPSEPKPLFWKLIGLALKPLGLAAAALILLDAFTSDYNDGLSVLMSLSIGFAALAGLCLLVRPVGGLGKAFVALVPIVALIVAGLAGHFHHVLPLTPAGSAGLALLVIWLSGTFLSLIVDWNSDSPADRVLKLGRRYVSRELRKRHPALEDAWLPHILPLVGETDIRRWQVRFGDPDEGRVVDSPGHDGPPFTGQFSLEEESRWATLLHILSRAELAEIDDEDSTPP